MEAARVRRRGMLMQDPAYRDRLMAQARREREQGTVALDARGLKGQRGDAMGQDGQGVVGAGLGSAGEAGAAAGQGSASEGQSRQSSARSSQTEVHILSRIGAPAPVCAHACGTLVVTGAASCV